MDQVILHKLFFDNPELPEQVYQFCQAMPDYREAKRAYSRAAAELLALVGYEKYCRFEECLNRLWYLEEMGFYRFGLGLRKEVLQALGGGE